MSDERLNLFADRLNNRTILTAEEIVGEAVILFSEIRNKERDPNVVGLIGKSSVYNTIAYSLSHYKVCQYGIQFFFDPSALFWKLSNVTEQYLTPAMSWLSSIVPEGSVWAEPSLELPQGVLDSGKKYLNGIELRCVIMEIKVDEPNVVREWVTIRDWYNINTDEMERDVPVGHMMHFSVRTKIPLVQTASDQ